MAHDLLDRVSANIAAITNDPYIPLDPRLFEEAELILPQTLDVDDKTNLLVQLSSLLPRLQQDPNPAVNLLQRLLSDYSYGEILSIGNIPFTDGLEVGDHMVAFNKLILSILEKATANAADAASVAGMLDTVLALVRLWLCTSDTGVASQASMLLINLLMVDLELDADMDAHVPSRGQGLMWKRIFGDRDVYGTFLESCSLTGPSWFPSLKLSKSQRTIAQARLMEWLPKVAAMDFNAIQKSHHRDIEAAYNFSGGLLDFVAIHMVDIKDDVLMHRCLIEFYSDILYSTRPSFRLRGTATESPGLTYLIAKGLHASTSALYIPLPGVQLDPLESMFLYGPAANYIATYASSYPEHFLASQMPDQVIERLNVTLERTPSKWAHMDSPKHDLHLLASLPRRALLATTDTAAWRASPLSLLPSQSTHPDALSTLATIFHGPARDIVYQPGGPAEQDPSTTEEAAQARTLFYHYILHNPYFWRNITTHADTVALKDLALSAINCLTAVITANWSDSPLPSMSRFMPTPASGHLAILSMPASEATLPYLLKPAPSFANLVGGRGDPESAAYKIAMAKSDALKALQSRLVIQVQQTPRQGYEEILATINKRLAEGPFSREGEIGGRIATMEL